MPERTCLTCRWMSKEPLVFQLYECLYPENRIPLALDLLRLPVNAARPFENCPCYEERKADA